MWNKQRYCWQLQNHVWIQNFRRSNWKITMLGKSAYLLVVLWHGRSCQQVCGTILRVGEQNDSTNPQSIYSCIDDHHFKEEELGSVGELSKLSSQIVLKCFYLARIGRPDIPWSVNKLARSITKWTTTCDKRLSRLISYIHHTCEQTVLPCGKHCQTMQTGTVSRLRFCRRSGATWCIFSKSYVCSNQLDV